MGLSCIAAHKTLNAGKRPAIWFTKLLSKAGMLEMMLLGLTAGIRMHLVLQHEPGRGNQGATGAAREKRNCCKWHVAERGQFA